MLSAPKSILKKTVNSEKQKKNNKVTFADSAKTSCGSLIEEHQRYMKNIALLQQWCNDNQTAKNFLPTLDQLNLQRAGQLLNFAQNLALFHKEYYDQSESTTSQVSQLVDFLKEETKAAFFDKAINHIYLLNAQNTAKQKKRYEYSNPPHLARFAAITLESEVKKDAIAFAEQAVGSAATDTPTVTTTSPVATTPITAGLAATTTTTTVTTSTTTASASTAESFKSEKPSNKKTLANTIIIGFGSFQAKQLYKLIEFFRLNDYLQQFSSDLFSIDLSVEEGVDSEDEEQLIYSNDDIAKAESEDKDDIIETPIEDLIEIVNGLEEFNLHSDIGDDKSQHFLVSYPQAGSITTTSYKPSPAPENSSIDDTSPKDKEINRPAAP